MSLANTSYQGEFIFSGTANVQPFVADSINPAAVTYQGNSGTNSVAVSQGYSLQVNLPGSQLFTTPGADPFKRSLAWSMHCRQTRVLAAPSRN
jgi:flagellar hook-associated protein 3 FlgL